MDLATDRAAYRLADKFDQDVLGYVAGFELNSSGVWVARTTAVGTKSETSADSDELLAIHKLEGNDFGGSASESIAVGLSGTYDATPLQVLNRMSRKLDQQNVDKDNRWVVVDPVFMERLMDEDSKFMSSDYQTGEQLSNGKLSSGKVRGFRVYESNNLPVIGTGPDTIASGGSASNYGVIVAGHDSAIATAEQINKTESFRDPDSFGDIVRGLHLYGRKILRPQGLIRAIYNVSN